jgi:hypothetical protein
LAAYGELLELLGAVVMFALVVVGLFGAAVLAALFLMEGIHFAVREIRKRWQLQRDEYIKSK